MRVIFWALWLVELLEHVEKMEGGGMTEEGWGEGVGLVLELKFGSESNRTNSSTCHNHWHLPLKI